MSAIVRPSIEELRERVRQAPIMRFGDTVTEPWYIDRVTWSSPGIYKLFADVWTWPAFVGGERVAVRVAAGEPAWARDRVGDDVLRAAGLYVPVRSQRGRTYAVWAVDLAGRVGTVFQGPVVPLAEPPAWPCPTWEQARVDWALSLL